MNPRQVWPPVVVDVHQEGLAGIGSHGNLQGLFKAAIASPSADTHGVPVVLPQHEVQVAVPVEIGHLNRREASTRGHVLRRRESARAVP